MLEQQRESIAEMISISPTIIEVERNKLTTNNRGELIESDEVEIITIDNPVRLYHFNKIGNYERVTSDKTVNEHCYRVLIDYQTELFVNDVFQVGTLKYKVTQPSVELRIAGDIYGKYNDIRQISQ